MKKYLVLFILLAGCDKDDCYYYYPPFRNITNYNINIDIQTPNGINIDTGGYEIDLIDIDKRFAEMWSCIKEVANLNPIPKKEWQCSSKKFYKEERLKHECITIKIVEPFYAKPNCSGYNWQFIGKNENSTSGLLAKEELCMAKGLKPDPECPCMWRTAIQYQNIIISPPPEQRPNISEVSFPAPYTWDATRIITSCNYVWTDFAKCLR